VTDESILALLKFGGPIVGLISALWSTTQKITYEAADGVKRLTLQGRVLVGIIAVSALISILALGFGTIVEKQNAQRAAAGRAADERKAEARDRKAADEKARDRAQAAAAHQADVLGRLAAAANAQRQYLEQRFLIISAAAAQQRREAQISMQIGREANQRLSEAERTLAEFERINYPLRSIDARVEVSLNLDGLNLSAFWTAMAEELRERQLKQPHGDHRPVVALPRGRIGQYHDLEYSANRMRFTLTFVSPGAAFPSSATRAMAGIRPFDVPADVTGPIVLTLVLESAEADVARQKVTAVYHLAKALEMEGVIESGEKLSVSDVNRLVPVLTFEPGPPWKAGGKRATHILVGVSYSLNAFQRFGASPGFRIADQGSFILNPQSLRR
jgi:hypothetical protein